VNTAPMLMAPRNRAYSKYDVAIGGRWCACCDVAPAHNRSTRRHVKRRERNLIRLFITKEMY